MSRHAVESKQHCSPGVSERRRGDALNIPANSGQWLPALFLDNGLIVAAFADAANKINIGGYIFTVYQ